VTFKTEARLMSADGHQRLLGYKAERTGEIRAVVGN